MLRYILGIQPDRQTSQPMKAKRISRGVPDKFMELKDAKEIVAGEPIHWHIIKTPIGDIMIAENLIKRIFEIAKEQQIKT